jgi:hypothetical protein
VSFIEKPFTAHYLLTQVNDVFVAQEEQAATAARGHAPQ